MTAEIRPEVTFFSDKLYKKKIIKLKPDLDTYFFAGIGQFPDVERQLKVIVVGSKP